MDDDRLDARGHHATPVKKPEVKASLVMPTRTVIEDGVTYIESNSLRVAFGKAEPQTFSIGENAFLTGERKGRPAEIAKILKIWMQTDPVPDADDEGIWFSVHWYWRPESLEDLDELDPAWEVRAMRVIEGAGIDGELADDWPA